MESVGLGGCGGGCRSRLNSDGLRSMGSEIFTSSNQKSLYFYCLFPITLADLAMATFQRQFGRFSNYPLHKYPVL
jgi:hypothetical protein